MIVKKIATSKRAPPKSKAANVRSLADYIAGPDAGDDGEKVEHSGALNLLNIDHAAQVEEMIDLAEVARRCPQPVQHWILSWREGEQPTAAQADEAVRLFLGEMGLGEHQAIYALHRDTHNWHLHLAVNRVHPDTEKVVTVNKGFDHEVAHRALARIEQRQGWQREHRALFQAFPDGDVERARPRGLDGHQPSTCARDFEERAGERSAERVAIDDAAPIVRHARSWQEVHQGLAAKGIRFERKGSGAILWIGGQAVKASAAGRECSMASLQKRLGEFEQGPALPRPSPEPARPLEPSSTLLPAYVLERREHYKTRDAARAKVAEHRRDEWRSLTERHRTERADVLCGPWKGRGALLNATRSVLAARQAQEKAELRERLELERAALRRVMGRFPSYEEWLRERGRDVADEWRHRERRPPTIEGGTFDQPLPRDIRAFQAVLDGGTVHYHLAGGRGHGRPAFTDRGRIIDIHDGTRRESVLAALQVSAQKWGSFTIEGGDQFRRACVELAAEHGFRITNPDLQHQIESERERLRQARIPDVPERRPAQQPEVMTPAAIYRRHLAELSREQPRRGGQDPSRIDAQIAVRMSVTGHSQEQIARAIADAARVERPQEKRNWDRYARRAVDYAFSPPGRDIADRLRHHQQRLLRLEGPQDEIQLPRRLGGPTRGL